ncbi:MAG: Hsp20/alpha crystallin family protein [Methanobacterium sp.]|uniref:Hsp20/alpha crystallin family protein n=1 Tax=Methanobacterium sp. TaxID=2164 RepID=UPI003C79147D
MEEKLKKPLHVKEGKVIKTPSEKNETSSTSGTDTGKTSNDKSMKEKMGEKKENMSNKIHEVKEGASKKTEDIQEGISDVTEEANKTKEEYEKESEKEGMTPAEKVLNDIVTRFRQGTGQINDAISDYNTKPEDGKESKSNKPKKALKPLVDVLETNDTVYLIADISGVKKDNISIGISKNSVELTVKYKEDAEIEDAKFTQKERSYGETNRTVKLSSEVKVHEAKANFRNCTLTITLPKVVEDITKVDIDD